MPGPPETKVPKELKVLKVIRGLILWLQVT